MTPPDPVALPPLSASPAPLLADPAPAPVTVWPAAGGRYVRDALTGALLPDPEPELAPTPAPEGP